MCGVVPWANPDAMKPQNTAINCNRNRTWDVLARAASPVWAVPKMSWAGAGARRRTSSGHSENPIGRQESEGRVALQVPSRICFQK